MRVISLAGVAAALIAGASAIPQIIDAKVTNTLTTTFTKTKVVKQTEKVVSTITETITATEKDVITTTTTKTKGAGAVSTSTVTVTAPVQTITEPASTFTVVGTAAPSTVTVTAPASTITVTASGSVGLTTSTSASSINASSKSASSTTGATTSSSTNTATTCVSTVVTAYTDIPAAVASCMAITLQDIDVPGNSSIVLSKLKANSVVTFAGTTFFEYSAAALNGLDLITVSGTNITIDGAPGNLINGNGPAWWDGLGSNGGVQKPNHFFVASKVLGTSFIKNLNIKNYPVHCFYINNCVGVTFSDINLDMSDGYAPNSRSNGLPAAHNTDGFDLSNTNNTSVLDSTVTNQDDCVAITSGNNVVVSGITCSGSHGLSIGSVGGKSSGAVVANTVTNIMFKDSSCTNCENGARIKSNYNTTGYIGNITYQNIQLNNITSYGIDIQQDYLNGGPTGNPSSGVKIENIYMTNITGTAEPDARDYYILCGEGSCNNFVWDDIHITGGSNSSCNFHPTGDFVCTDV